MDLTLNHVGSWVDFILLLLLYRTGFWGGWREVDRSSSGQCSMAALWLRSVILSGIVRGVKQEECDMFKPGSILC